MRKYKIGFAGVFLWLSIAGCTSLSEGSGNMPPNPDNDRRVQFGSGDNAELRRQMDEQSSDINRKKNIEEGNNSPATTPPALRPQQVPNAPVDTTRHNVQRPLKNRKRVNQ